MKSQGYVPASYNAFIIVASDAIFTVIGTKCDCWGCEVYIIYWYYFSCDPLEHISPEVEVLYVTGREVLWDPILSPLQKVA